MIDGLARIASKEYTSGSSINTYEETKIINLDKISKHPIIESLDNFICKHEAIC
jgi:hypothetical protein